MDEVGALFPFAHLHLGCDELPDGAWDGSPRVAELKQKNDLATRDDVQGSAMAARGGSRPMAYALPHGKRPRGGKM